jgi:hypothetical protein
VHPEAPGGQRARSFGRYTRRKGYWADANPGGLYEASAGNIRMNYEGLLVNIAIRAK